jgi:acyl carrier protein
VGLAAAQSNRGERLAQRGLASLKPEQCLAALGHLLARGSSQVAAMAFNVEQWCDYHPAAAESRLLADLRRPPVANGTTPRLGSPAPRTGVTREQLLDNDPATRQRLLDSYLCEQVARVLRLQPSRLDPRRPLVQLGLDSLMGVELRNRIETDLGVAIPLTRLFRDSSVARLGSEILEQLSTSNETTVAVRESTTAGWGEVNGHRPAVAVAFEVEADGDWEEGEV